MARRLILDAGAVSDLAQRDARVRANVRAAREAGARVVVPAVVVAESTRGSGPRDTNVNRVLAQVDIPPTDEGRARAAGRLLALPGASGRTIDALIVAEALSFAGRVDILTGDPDDLRLLAADAPKVTIRSTRGKR